MGSQVAKTENYREQRNHPQVLGRDSSVALGVGGRMFPGEGQDHGRVSEGLCERGGG